MVGIDWVKHASGPVDRPLARAVRFPKITVSHQIPRRSIASTPASDSPGRQADETRASMRSGGAPPPHHTSDPKPRKPEPWLR